MATSEYDGRADRTERAVSRETQVEEQCIRLQEAVDLLLERAERMESYLSKVLQPSLSEKLIDAAPEEMLVPLADFMRGLVRKVSHASDRLCDLTSRLEL